MSFDSSATVLDSILHIIANSDRFANKNEIRKECNKKIQMNFVDERSRNVWLVEPVRRDTSEGLTKLCDCDT